MSLYLNEQSQGLISELPHISNEELLSQRFYGAIKAASLSQLGQSNPKDVIKMSGVLKVL